MRPQIPSLGELPAGRDRTDVLRAEFSSPKLLSEMSERANLGATGMIDVDDLPAMLAELQAENHRLSLLVIETRNTPRESVNVMDMVDRQGAEVVQLNEQYNALSKRLAAKRNELNALQMRHPDILSMNTPAPSLAETSGAKSKKKKPGNIEIAALARVQENLRQRGQEQVVQEEKDNARSEELQSKMKETAVEHENAKHYGLVLKYMETMLRLEKPEKERAKTRLVEEIQEVDGQRLAEEQRMTSVSAEVEYLKLEKAKVMKAIMALREEHKAELAELEGQLTSRKELSRVFDERDGNRGEIKKEVRGDMTKKEEEALQKKRRAIEVKSAVSMLADGSEEFKKAEHMHRSMNKMLNASGCEEPLELLERIRNREQLQAELEEQAASTRERKHELADELRMEQKLLDQIKYAGFNSVMRKHVRDELESALAHVQTRVKDRGVLLRALVQKSLHPVSLGLQHLQKRLIQKLEIVTQLKREANSGSAAVRLPSIVNKFSRAGHALVGAGALVKATHAKGGRSFSLQDMFHEEEEVEDSEGGDEDAPVGEDEAEVNPRVRAENSQRDLLEDDVTIKVESHEKIIRYMIQLQATTDMVVAKLGPHIRQSSENSYESVLARLPTPSGRFRSNPESLQRAATKIRQGNMLGLGKKSSRALLSMPDVVIDDEESKDPSEMGDGEYDVAHWHRLAKKEIEDKLKPVAKPLRRGQVAIPPPSRKSSKKSM